MNIDKTKYKDFSSSQLFQRLEELLPKVKTISDFKYPEYKADFLSVCYAFIAEYYELWAPPYSLSLQQAALFIDHNGELTDPILKSAKGILKQLETQQTVLKAMKEKALRQLIAFNQREIEAHTKALNELLNNNN